MRVNGTLVEDKMRRFNCECEHFRFNKCPIYTHDGASAKFSTNSQEMDNTVGAWGTLIHEKNLKSKISCQTLFKSYDKYVHTVDNSVCRSNSSCKRKKVMYRQVEGCV